MAQCYLQKVFGQETETKAEGEAGMNSHGEIVFESTKEYYAELDKARARGVLEGLELAAGICDTLVEYESHQLADRIRKRASELKKGVEG